VEIMATVADWKIILQAGKEAIYPNLEAGPKYCKK